MTARTVYLVDDNTDFLDATSFWLQGMGLSTQAWDDPHKAIAAMSIRDRNEHACLLMDVRMPELSGLDVHDALTAAHAALPIIYMSGHADVPLAIEAMRKGAITLLEKPFDETALKAALDGAFAVAIDASREAPGRSPRQSAGTHADRIDPTAITDEAHQRFVAREARLSPREREVLGHVIEGVYNKNIADRLGLSIKTVELYRSRGMEKMQARSVAELTRMMVSERA